MSTPSAAPNVKDARMNLLARTQQFVCGLAADFWKDAPYDPAAFGKLPPRLNHWLAKLCGAAGAPTTSGPTPGTLKKAAVEQPHSRLLWHAEAGAIAEKLWGEERVQPASDELLDMMIAPLGLKPAMQVLDLTAGLGGAMRKIAAQHKITIKGLEADKALVQRGLEIAKTKKSKDGPISGYDPQTFAMPAEYDCVMARDLFYRIADRDKFFAALAACLKPQGQIVFTDLIVDPENKEKPAVLAWQKQENASPLGVISMAEAWAKCGFSLRVSEDQTAFYKKEVLAGLKRFAIFLGQGQKPDAETKKAILAEIEIWVHRMAALEQGMKFYRFHAVRS